MVRRLAFFVGFDTVFALMESEPNQPTPPRSPSLAPPLVAVAAWAVPGMGHVLLGKTGRGITIGLTILLLFTAGLFIGGIHVIDPPHLLAPGGSPLSNLLAKPWYIGQFLAGLPGVICGRIGAKYPQSHARMMEIGTLYTAVAGMLNLMAILDAAFRSAQPEPKP